ncbi:MAG: glycosyltransferase family 2 protein [bacterium]
MDVTIIIPVYNEEMAISDVVSNLKKEGFHNLLVINDGSNDSTNDIIQKLDVKVITHSYNKGYGASLKTGIRNATTDYVAIYDGDGQHLPSELKKIISANKNEEYDMVVGARNKDSHQVRNRKFGKWLINLFVKRITKRDVPDFNSGLRLYKKDIISKYLHLMPDGFSFSTTSTVTFLKLKYDVLYVPIYVKERIGRTSNIKAKDGFHTLLLLLNLSVLFAPLSFFIPVSIFFVLSSLIYFILYSIFDRIHVTSSMTMLFITGVIIFFMGIVCEQISSVRREQNS